MALTGTRHHASVRSHRQKGIRSMPPIIAVISNLPALLVVSRPRHGGRVVVLVDANQPAKRILAITRPLLAEAERKELARVLVG